MVQMVDVRKASTSDLAYEFEVVLTDDIRQVERVFCGFESLVVDRRPSERIQGEVI